MKVETLTVQQAVEQSVARFEHARRCGKDPIKGECKICRQSIAWFAALPLQTLSVVLSDGRPPAVALRQS
jgi:hypothetical protein